MPVESKSTAIQSTTEQQELILELVHDMQLAYHYLKKGNGKVNKYLTVSSVLLLSVSHNEALSSRQGVKGHEISFINTRPISDSETARDISRR